MVLNVGRLIGAMQQFVHQTIYSVLVNHNEGQLFAMQTANINEIYLYQSNRIRAQQHSTMHIIL